ncbi:MAG: hydrogen gas-evolving membrane-bound hydrogenase subunit E [Pseudomonadota bacterium]
MPIFDTLLALGMVGTAAIALFAKVRIVSVAGFMVMGLLVAMSWLRLGAPDVALAEAAIGAGVTGALFLRSAGRLGPIKTLPLPLIYRLTAAGLSAVIALVLFTFLSQSSLSTGLTPMVDERLADSGVSNPVTAVLLNFRAWDTLLEIAVLFGALALVALLPRQPVQPAKLGSLYLPFARVVAPLSVLVAGHLLWQGATEPGGAFQAGAVLAGGLSTLVLGRVFAPQVMSRALLMVIAAGGLVVFCLAALAAQGVTGTFMAYPDGQDKTWIIAIESAVTISIAATLVLLFTGLPPKPKQEEAAS